MVSAKPPRDLFRRPTLLPQELTDVVPQRWPFLKPAWLGATRRLVGTILSQIRPILTTATIDRDLPPDRAAMTPDPLGDLDIALAALDPHSDLFSVLERQCARTKLAVTEHDHMFFGDPATHRPFRNARHRRRLRVGRSPSNLRQRHPNHRPSNPRH